MQADPHLWASTCPHADPGLLPRGLTSRPLRRTWGSQHATVPRARRRGRAWRRVRPTEYASRKDVSVRPARRHVWSPTALRSLWGDQAVDRTSTLADAGTPAVLGSCTERYPPASHRSPFGDTAALHLLQLPSYPTVPRADKSPKHLSTDKSNVPVGGEMSAHTTTSYQPSRPAAAQPTTSYQSLGPHLPSRRVLHSR